MINKPYAEACDRNKVPILSVIESLFADCSSVLEIGSGTGQHAVFFAGKLPHLIWHTSDLRENHADIKAWLSEAETANLRAPVVLDVCQPEWPVLKIDAVFSANTVHIMHRDAVECLFAGVGQLLPEQGKFVLYGPFNINNQYTSESNANFDLWLKARDPKSGIRNFEDLNALAQASGLSFKQDYEMPANNRILYWQKQTQEK